MADFPPKGDMIWVGRYSNGIANGLETTSL